MKITTVAVLRSQSRVTLGKKLVVARKIDAPDMYVYVCIYVCMDVLCMYACMYVYLLNCT